MDIKDLTHKIFDTSTPKFLKKWIRNLANKVDALENELSESKKENQALKDKIKKLQGLPTQPTFSANDKTTELEDKDDSDDDDGNSGDKLNKRKEAAKKKRSKKKGLHIDKKQIIRLDPSTLDPSFVNKGSRKVIIQELNFDSNNIEFELQRYWSAEFGVVEAKLPEEYRNGFYGPKLKAFILTSYYHGNVTIKKIKKLLTAINIRISVREINRIINSISETLEDELDTAREKAIQEAGYQQIDDTGANLCFQNAYTTVTCNPYFTSLFTSFKKNRRNAVMALIGGKKRPLYKLNNHAIMTAYLANKSLNLQLCVEQYKSDRVYTEDNIDDFFKLEGIRDLKPRIQDMLKTCMLVGAFYDGELGEVGSALVSDDAGQFNQLYDDHLLCWVHELRHYKDLVPSFFEHQKELTLFMTEAKSFYKTFKYWIEKRGDELRDYLFKWFNEFFSRGTGYRLLDQRKKKSFNKMEKLLAPLFTEIKLPLDNNESERDIRCRVIKRKISLFNRTISGAKAWDFYLGLMQTSEKNGINFYNFLIDRLTLKNKIPQLAEIIKSRVHNFS